MDKNGIDIRHLTSANITREQVKAKFANDPRLDKILNIFDKVDALDEEFKEKNSECGKTGTLSCFDITEMRGLKLNWNSPNEKFVTLDNNHDQNVTDWELEQYVKDAKEYFGEDFVIEDYRKFLGFVTAEGEKTYSQDLENAAKETGLPKEIVEKVGIWDAKDLKTVTRDGKTYYEREGDGFRQVYNDKGELIEIREKNSSIIGYEGMEEITKFEEGSEIGSSYINHETGEEIHFLYGKTQEDLSYKVHIKDGIAVKQSHKYSEDENGWENMKLEDIIFGAGKPDSIKVSFKYDNNNQLTGIDIKENPPLTTTISEMPDTSKLPPKTTVDTSTLESLKSIIDGGARYGKDYDLKIKDCKLKIIPKITNKTGKDIPELKGDAFNKYIDLISKGTHTNEDFEVEAEENGNFRYNLKNNEARAFDSSYKSELYDKDGNFLSSLTVKENEVVFEKTDNGQKQITKMSFDDAFLEFALSGDFSSAGEILGNNDLLEGGRNIYKLADLYKEKTGRELILDVYDKIQENPDAENVKGMKNLLAKLQPHGQAVIGPDKRMEILENYKYGYEEFKDILNFNPYNSQIADMLPKIERVQNGENEFTEKINDDNFSVKITGGKLFISKNNGEELSIDVSKLPEPYVKNTFSKISASILYDIAKTGTQIEVNDDVYGDGLGGGTNGYYYQRKDKRGIKIDPNSTIGQRAISVIAHESGHMCDAIDDKENAIKSIKEYLKDPWATFNLDKPLTVNELLETQGTVHPASPNDEKLKEIFEKEYENYRKNPPTVNANAEYALTNLNEFFAESYSLLNTGNCKSALVIANYFPESLGRIKELIEQNRASREK